MGEVYRAKDTKLKREVVPKVLLEAFARDPERMVRFQREAEMPTRTELGCQSSEGKLWTAMEEWAVIRPGQPVSFPETNFGLAKVLGADSAAADPRSFVYLDAIAHTSGCPSGHAGLHEPAFHRLKPVPLWTFSSPPAKAGAHRLKSVLPISEEKCPNSRRRLT
jgi:serine/threonine protein kinase